MTDELNTARRDWPIYRPTVGEAGPRSRAGWTMTNECPACGRYMIDTVRRDRCDRCEIARLLEENAELKLWESLREPMVDLALGMKAKIDRLREEILKRGLWREAPCILCGYNGRGYFQPDTHSCAREGR